MYYKDLIDNSISEMMQSDSNDEDEIPQIQLPYRDHHPNFNEITLNQSHEAIPDIFQ